MKQVMALAATIVMLVGCGGSEPKEEAPVDTGPAAWTCQFSNGQTPTVRSATRRDAMELCKTYATENKMEDSTLIRVEAAQ